MTQFVATYESALSPAFCQACIQKFESSGHRIAGRTGHGVDASKKVSTDLTIDHHLDEWTQENATLQAAVTTGLRRYIRDHPFLLAGAISLKVQDQAGNHHEITPQIIRTMDDAALTRLIGAVYRLGTINLQKYDAGKGGYFYWHSEHYPHPNDPDNNALHRVLLWMFFLNDVDEGGETEFYYQQLKVRPTAGTMIIAPAGFTHTHRGAMPVSNDKYIFTSWVLYQQARVMYGG